MSFIDRKGSINNPRRASLQPTYDEPHENILPPSVNARTTRHISFSNEGGRRSSNLKSLAGSTVSETVFLISKTEAPSWRRFLVGPIILAYVAAYMTGFATFGLYTYGRIQAAKYPNESYNSTSSCDVDKNSTSYKHQVEVQKEASSWNSYFALVVGIPAIFSNIIFGSITDRFGRKFLFIVPCVGTLIRTSYSAVGIHFNFKLEYFLVGYFIEGCTGQIFAILLVAFTYVSDITPQKGRQRAFAIAMIELAIGVGIAGFSFSTGYFIQDYGFYYPMLSTVPMLMLALLLIMFLPESFPKEKRSTETTSCFGNFMTAYDLFFGKFNRGRRWMYNTLMVIFLLNTFAIFGRMSTDPLLQLDEPFCWTPEKLGYFSALRNGLQQAAGMGLIKLLQMAMTEEGIAILGCFSFAAAFVLEGFAKTDLVLYIVPLVGCLGMLTIPMVRALLSKLTRADQQGAVFASIAAVETTVNLGASVLANVIYAHTVSYFRGSVYMLYAAVNVICAIMMGVYKFGSRRTLPILDVRR